MYRTKNGIDRISHFFVSIKVYLPLFAIPLIVSPPLLFLLLTCSSISNSKHFHVESLAKFFVWKSMFVIDLQKLVTVEAEEEEQN